MNITIILPAVHVTSKRQQRGDESPQPTTPFPPISITPSPTPFSESTTYNPDDYKDLIEEYNREISENHLTKSRAEIVARQAAYDDIEITRSDPGTAGNSRKSVSPIVATRAGGGTAGSAPCPYCSSSESIKSEASVRNLTLDNAASVVNLINKRKPSPRRSTAQNSPSTDRTTESPSSVDTVNTVIQSKAYDILGELKQQEENVRDKFDIASTLDDSFESIDSVQELIIKDDIQDERHSSELTTSINDATQESFRTSTPQNTATPSTTPTSKGEKPNTPPSFSPSPPSYQREHDYNYGIEDRNLDFLYEEDEEEENEEKVESLDEIATPKALEDTEEIAILDENQGETKEEPLIESEEHLSSVQVAKEDILKTNQEEAQSEVIETSDDAQHVLESKQEEVVTVTSILSTDKVEQEQKNDAPAVASDDSSMQHEAAEVPIENAQETQDKVEEESIVKAETEKVNVEEERKEKEEEIETELLEENQVPVTEKPGNKEVMIIVTQDDMPPANISDSDEEQEKGNTDTTEKPEQESLINAKSPVETTTSDKGETESEPQHQEQSQLPSPAEQKPPTQDHQGDKILREIAETVQLRHDAELRRAELIQRANDMQTLIKEKRDKINRRHEFWHKKYIEESSMTRPLEAACNSLRAELNTVHRRLLAHLEGRDLPLRLRDGPSKKANYKIMAARLQHEIKELQQKAKAAKLRLESEIKLKEQAEREVRELRNDLAHKKVIMSLARSQIAALPSVHPRGYDPLGY